MQLLYTLSILAYRSAIGLASLYNPKAKKWIAGRRDIFKKLESSIDKQAPLAWFHCASLGEFEQGRPVIEAFRKAYPHYKILLTFFSPSGYEVRKSYTGADYIFYLPIDTRANAERFISITRPQIALFVKYEFWFNYLDILYRKSIPFYLISASFRGDQHFFKGYGSWFRKALHHYRHIFVQNETSRQLLSSIGVTNVSVSGDTRFDRVAEIASHAKDISIAELFSRNAQVIVAGSTWPGDEQLLIEYIREHIDVKLIIAPHEIAEEKIVSIISSCERFTKAIRYSQANAAVSDARVLIIDNIGMLSSLYRYGQVAYIGGGFGKGIHNILEAATYGMPVIFGPNYQKFNEAKELVRLGGAFSITGSPTLNETLNALLPDSRKLKEASAISRNYVERNTGATGIILRTISPALAAAQHV
jgi:3-deoxy-D-manno-octulosonic-acid transferase